MMKLKVFEPIDIADPHNTRGIGESKEYADFLEQDGITIRIRKIDNFVDNDCSLIYYEDIPKVQAAVTVTDRLSDLDVGD